MSSQQSLSGVIVPETSSLNNLFFFGPIMDLSLLLSFKRKTFGGGVKDSLISNTKSH